LCGALVRLSNVISCPRPSRMCCIDSVMSPVCDCIGIEGVNRAQPPLATDARQPTANVDNTSARRERPNISCSPSDGPIMLMLK